MAWGHVFGMRFSLCDRLQGSCGKLGVLYHNALHWAIAAPTHIRGAAVVFGLSDYHNGILQV